MANLNPPCVTTEAPDTRRLLEQARNGNTDAYCDLYRAYATRLLRQAVALCGNAALAEELAQDTLVEAWRCLRRYNGRCDFFTWLCAILMNQYRNTLRRNRFLSFSGLRNRERDEMADAVETLADGGSLPDEAAELREQSALVRKCIETLPPRHQQVIYLRFYVDDSLEGIAAALGCSVGTVKSRLFHALEKLRRMNALNEQFEDLNVKG